MAPTHAATIPSKYAYKEEGHDMDDGICDYEVLENTEAQLIRQQWQSTLTNDDFMVPTSKSASTVKTSSSLPKQPSHRASALAAFAQRKEVPVEIKSLIRTLHRTLSGLKTPWTAAEVQRCKNMVAMATRGVFMLLYYTERTWLSPAAADEETGEEEDVTLWSDHPVVEEFTTLFRHCFPSSSKADHDSDALGTFDNVKCDAALDDDDEDHKDATWDGTDVAENPRVAVTSRMLDNRGLTKARPKDRKNPRVNQKRKFRRGVRKVKGTGAKTHVHEPISGFHGVPSIKSHVVRTTRLS